MSTAPAIRCADSELGYPAFAERAARVAAGLRAEAVAPDDRVAVVLRNSVEFLEVSAGIAAAGARPVAVNWHLAADELRYLLADCAARLVFTHTEFLERVAASAPEGCAVLEVVPSPQLVAEYGLHTGYAAASGRAPDYEAWLARHEPPAAEPDAPSSPSVFYTSGTTGRPKGVLRERPTEQQRAASVEALERHMGVGPGVRTLIPAPMYHTAPNATANAAVAVGADVTIAPRFEPEWFLRLLQDHAIEQVQVVPTMFVRLLKLPERVRTGYDLSTLRRVVHAAAPCPPEVKRAVIDWLGPIVHEYYGGTESGAVVWCDSREWLEHPGTVGRPVDGAAVRVLRDDDTPCTAGETGTVYLKPPPHWPDFTYVGKHERRREIERDGFVTLGDMGRLDEDGFLYLTDRATDMIISGGVNIYPAEIEAALIELPGIRDLAVFGIPDEEYGESVAAHIDAEPGLTEQRVRAYAREHLAGYKVPKRIVFDDRLPREESGKLFKRRLRDRYRE